MKRTLIHVCALLLACPAFTASAQGLRLRPNRVTLADGRRFDLNLPEGYGLSVAAEGLKRVRFMSRAPDGRIFVTDMYNRADNTRGVVYILDGFDRAAGKFRRVTTYLSRLRNPNSVAFYTDPQGAHWLYLALTDRLVRYRYTPGEQAPTSAPQVLARFPDYGLSYKYGGWHLTRTVAVGPGGKIYVAVGSSCNACEEKEEVRASVLVMDADGSNQRHFARGLRNAVGLRYIDGQLYATNMGADHLGDRRPNDTLYALRDEANYGWPYCFVAAGRVLPDPKLNPGERKMRCRNVPATFAAFPAHASPLGLEHFGPDAPAELRDSFLVGLHGSSKLSLDHGYRVARVRAGSPPEEFISGFLQRSRVHGRPVDVLQFGSDAFLLTDDHAGVIYYIYKK